MNITFLIGNGFDINLGLRTSYKDFYNYFIEYSKQDNLISKHISKNYELWKDLELALGKMTKEISEDLYKKFIDDKFELDKLLIEYLEKEQIKLLRNNPTIDDAITKTITEYYYAFTQRDIDNLLQTYNGYMNDTYYYEFISFNYTNVLYEMIATNKKRTINLAHKNTNGGNIKDYIGNVLQIHGTLEDSMILGVNDESQIENIKLREDKNFLDIFVKSRMNEICGRNKAYTTKQVIDKSHIIILFGLSVGETDKIWWEYIISWLNTSILNKLVLFYYSEAEINRKYLIKYIEFEKEIKNKFIRYGKLNQNDNDKIFKQIIISTNKNIFNFK